MEPFVTEVEGFAAGKTIGLFGGRDIQGAVLCDAITGESVYYDISEVPTWVDNVYTPALIMEQYDYHGTLVNGFINSILGQRGVTVTTEGYNYIALNDDVYVYTGITSANADQSNLGFLLSNQRTKETKFYDAPGATEYAAMASAQGVVQDLGYVATFPLLLNIAGEPTYFIPLKDATNLVKSYAMVNVAQYQVVTVASTVSQCEQEYIRQMAPERRREMYDKLLAEKIPCLVYSRGQMPDEDMQELCRRYQVPLLVSDKTTSDLMAEVIRWLKVKLAPCISIHGVLVDVFGEGVLITGESGIGKSEAALELIKRGHRLVSDDVVELRKVSDVTLVGSAPDITRHFIELRGIGIIDVKTLFGVESVKDTQSVDLVIKLEEWDRDKEYDRLGLHEEYTEYLGNKIVCHSLPIRPGRNLAIIVESAAVNHRQKKMGYNAAEELYKRVQANLAKKREEK